MLWLNEICAIIAILAAFVGFVLNIPSSATIVKIIYYVSSVIFFVTLFYLIFRRSKPRPKI